MPSGDIGAASNHQPSEKHRMPKQQPSTSKPNIAKLSGPGVSAKLGDYLAGGGSSAKLPTAGKSTGPLPRTNAAGSDDPRLRRNARRAGTRRTLAHTQPLVTAAAAHPWVPCPPS
jgi:hypothetical protein